MKFFSIIIGGFIVFSIHYSNIHYGTDISLFSVAPHAIEGTIFTIVGMLIGAYIYSLFLGHEDS